MEAALGRRELLLPLLLLVPPLLDAALLGPAAPLQLGQVPTGPGRGGASPSPSPSPCPSRGGAGPRRGAGRRGGLGSPGRKAGRGGLGRGLAGPGGRAVRPGEAGEAGGSGGRCAGCEGVLWVWVWVWVFFFFRAVALGSRRCITPAWSACLAAQVGFSRKRTKNGTKGQNYASVTVRAVFLLSL